MKRLLYYCYDAYCGWCYGFSPVIRKLSTQYADTLEIEVLSGGMIITGKPHHISATAGYIRETYKTVEELTGIKFGEDYLWHIFNPDKSDWYPSSEKPAIAMCIFKEYHPHLQVQFAYELQHSLHYEGRDLCDDESYLYLLEKYNIPQTEFYAKLKAKEYKAKAFYEFALVRQLQVTGFPALFLQASESKLYLLARGYTDYNTLQQNLQRCLKEINISSA
jgi:putative protein-disulfide isomerase